MDVLVMMVMGVVMVDVDATSQKQFVHDSVSYS